MWSRRTHAALALLAGVLAGAGACSAPSRGTAAAPTPEPDACAERDRVEGDGVIVDALLAAFPDTPVVAFGEHHGNEAEHRVLQALVCDPQFADTVDAVVVEFANRRYQAVVDRYVDGADVAPGELAEVWRESTQRSGVWDAPVYRRFFAAVRSANRGREPEDRVRVLAGDPPIDWSTITDTEDCDRADPTCLEHWDREASFAEVVLGEVLGRGRTALLVAGAGHMTRRLEPGPPPSIPQLLEAAHPGTVTVVLTHDRFLRLDATAEATLTSGPVPALVPLRASPLGAVDTCILDDGYACGDHTLVELADAYLYLGGLVPARGPGR